MSAILQRQLFSSSRKLGGLLFGYHVGDHLRIVTASTVGIPDWYEGEHRNELKIDQRFILGWSEALCHLYRGRIEWVGNWIVSAEQEDFKAQSDVDVLLEWSKTGLFDDRNILLTARHEKDNFIVKTYAVDSDKTECEIPNMFSRSKIS